MKITQIRLSRHRLELDPPFRASWDTRPRTAFEAVIVRVETDEGLVGIGSGDLMVGFAGHEELFIGHDPRDLDRHFRILSNIAFHYGRCWPLDLALWDLAGKAAGLPVWRLLGDRSPRVRAYASSGTLRGPDEMAEAALRFVDEGFGAMKVRFHRGDWRDDIRALEAVRAAVGDSLDLMVDCNQGWRMPWDDAEPWTVKDALAVGRELERLGVYWMEEPLHRGDRDGMRRLRETLDVRIAAGEMNRELYEFRDLIDARAVDVLQPDAALTGGITGLRHVAAAAAAAGLMFTPHTWTNGIGLLANLHLTAGAGNASYIEYPYDPPEWPAAARDFMLQAPTIAVDGWLDAGESPGLGIVLDEDRLRETAVA